MLHIPFLGTAYVFIFGFIVFNIESGYTDSELLTMVIIVLVAAVISIVIFVGIGLISSITIIASGMAYAIAITIAINLGVFLGMYFILPLIPLPFLIASIFSMGIVGELTARKIRKTKNRQNLFIDCDPTTENCDL